MNTQRIVKLGFGAVLLILIFVSILISLSPEPSDQIQIANALKSSISASREGRAGGVLDLLSQRLQVNGEEVQGNTQTIAKIIRSQKPDVVIEEPLALVTGDEARIVSPVTLKVNILGQSIERKLSSVTLIFRRESYRKWGIIPRSSWRLAEVQVPPGSEQDWNQ